MTKPRTTKALSFDRHKEEFPARAISATEQSLVFLFHYLNNKEIVFLTRNTATLISFIVT